VGGTCPLPAVHGMHLGYGKVMFDGWASTSLHYTAFEGLRQAGAARAPRLLPSRPCWERRAPAILLVYHDYAAIARRWNRERRVLAFGFS